MCQQFLYRGLAGLEFSNGLAQSVSVRRGAQQMQCLLQAVVVLQRNHDDMFPALTGDYRRFVILAHRVQSLLEAGSRLTKSQDVHIELSRLPATRLRAQALRSLSHPRGQERRFRRPEFDGDGIR
ncbi:hypothetical protein WJ34_24760 [Burkholderia ubonensis]|nr:hypothetical protein WJ34_24760 [Burkholderia ubonensis]KWI14657.1 hypothetical protein WM02_12960 [Burkholderia ubonensis]ODQ37634.1 hypothetical protein BGV63_15815 [Burkholderia ubonensis]